MIGRNGELPNLYRAMKNRAQGTKAMAENTNGGPKPGIASTEVVGLPGLMGLITTLIATGQIDFSTERMQMVVVVGFMLCWALLFVGRTLVKMGYAKSGATATFVQTAVETALKAYEQKSGKDLPLPNDPPAVPGSPVVPKVGSGG